MANMDPNKYSKNANINPESKLSIFLAVLRMGLMMIGIFGIAFDMFREKGWASKLMNGMIGSTTNLVLAAIILLALWAFNHWISRPRKSETTRIGDIPMYAMMAVGGYYIYRLFTTSGF